MIRSLHTAVAAFILLATTQAQISFTANNALLVGAYGSPGCVVDMNGDHLDDVVRFSGTQLNIDYQQPGGTFVHQTFNNATVSPSWSICAGDLDNNGYNDLLLGNGAAVSFLHANADGTAYVEDYDPTYIFSQRSTMADIDNDGWLDAFVCHDVAQSHPYRNDGAGNVDLDFTLINTLAVGGNYAAIWCDYDNDSDIDLYITKCRSGAPVGDPQRINLLYRNNNDGTFTSVALAAGMDDGAQSWSTVFEDFDNDGDFDAFIVNHTDLNRFMRNNGDGTFTDIIGTTGIDAGDLGAWESQGADFDNDGWVDIFSEVGGGIYHNNGDGTFTNINVPQDEGGIGDLNNDGWLDYQIGNTIYFNNGGSDHWIKVELDGIWSNTNGIGARLRLYGAWGMQTREVRSGQGFSHMNSLQAHFGIGTATTIDSLVIDWPSGVHTHIGNPGIDQLHIVPEADCLLSPFIITAVGNTTLCPGQTVELQAPAGFAGYAWSNGEVTQSIIVDVAGNYTVIASDGGGCLALSNIVAVTQVGDETPLVTVNGDDTFCAGGSVELESTPGLSYLWSDGQTSQTATITQSGTYTVEVVGFCSTNTSAPVTITVQPAAALPVVSDVSLPGPGVATLTATGDNINWYAGEFDTTPVGTGNSWDTPVLFPGSYTYWCEANAIYGGALEAGGKPDNSGGGGMPSTGAYSYFDAWEPFTLQTVKVYAIGAGLRTVNLCDAAGIVLQTADLTLADGEQVITLNFSVPVGIDMSLRCPQNDLFRNNAGVTYPYAIGTVGSLTDSYYGPTYYYYFYDWHIQKAVLVCPSERVPVEVLVGTVGMPDVQEDAVAVFPVPARDMLTIINVEPGAEIDLLDATGRSVRSLRSAFTRMEIPLGGLAAGSYLLRTRSRAGVSTVDVVITR